MMKMMVSKFGMKTLKATTNMKKTMNSTGRSRLPLQKSLTHSISRNVSHPLFGIRTKNLTPLFLSYE